MSSASNEASASRIHGEGVNREPVSPSSLQIECAHWRIMLSDEDNEIITNTNRGTPTGELFRRFWLPVALADELSGTDCIPVRVRVLGEDLIAFRDSENRVGLVDAFPPPTAAPRCSSPATKRQVCAVFTTAGSSTWTVSVRTCRTRPKARRIRTR